MRYKPLGNSGLRVSELALGAMTFRPETGFGVDKDESQRVYDAFLLYVGVSDTPAWVVSQANDLGVTPWGIVGSGVLTGKYNRDPEAAGRAKLRDAVSERSLRIAAAVIEIAEELGVTPSQVAINWVRQGPAVIVPLIGARTVEQLAENLGCLEFSLSEEHKVRLDEVSAIEAGFPHDMLGPQSAAQTRIVDNHRPWSTPR
jgi:aryl-alcohol dehydrogenase-like predicted oxidoreductase